MVQITGKQPQFHLIVLAVFVIDSDIRISYPSALYTFVILCLDLDLLFRCICCIGLLPTSPKTSRKRVFLHFLLGQGGQQNLNHFPKSPALSG